MSNAVIARRYARAFFELAAAENAVSEFGEGLESFFHAWNASGELRVVLPAADLHVSQRQAVLDELAKALGLQGLVHNFLKLLVDKRRINIYSYIVEAYRKLVAERAGQVTATITTASAIEEQQIAEIRDAVAAMKNKDVQVETKVDAELLGGVVIRVGDEIFDGSIAAELQRMRQQLLSAEL